jgi:hypothetical protein
MGRSLLCVQLSWQHVCPEAASVPRGYPWVQTGLSGRTKILHELRFVDTWPHRPVRQQGP